MAEGEGGEEWRKVVSNGTKDTGSLHGRDRRVLLERCKRMPDERERDLRYLNEPGALKGGHLKAGREYREEWRRGYQQ